MEQDYQNHHPFDMDPSDAQIQNAIDSVSEVHSGCPETTCCSKAVCCRAACPNMYYAEFIAIRRGHVEGLTSKERTTLTIECVKRYLQGQDKPKPCVFLREDNKCNIYPHRHLKCRLYGLIPDSVYEWAVNSVAQEMGRPPQDMPLCNQCTFVKIKPEFAEKFPDGKVPEFSMKNMENKMREIDRGLGMSKDTQDNGFGFLTYHDWHLLFEFGEEFLEMMTKFRLKWTDSEKDKFIADLKIALEARNMLTEQDEK